MEQLHKAIDNHPSSGYGYIAGKSNTKLSPVTKTSQKIIKTVLDGYQGHVTVQLWDGSQIIKHDNATCTVIFNDPSIIRQLILSRKLSKLTEAYLEGRISIDGDMETLFDMSDHFRRLHIPWTKQWNLLRLALKLPRHHNTNTQTHKSISRTTHKNGQSSIAHHYDVGNDFYGLWLDPQMVYSCAYFKDEQQPLSEAQEEKLDYLCRKLRLQPGQTLLEIGCGWGALAIHAAKNYGVTVHGITLSKAQQLKATERVQSEGLQDKVTIELCDYRNLPEHASYDRVVSVGMFEHVGLKNFPTYFGTVKRVLKSGGLFLNHGITSETRWKRTPITRFINRYIFPDGELTRVSEVTDAMEKAGFEVLDTEGLRRHYTYTLRHWVQALEKNYQQAVQQTSEVTYRLWRLYMAGSAYFFNEGSLGVHQLLVSHQHDTIAVPLRRDDLYNEK